MAENVRGLLSLADEQSAELHGGKNDSIKKHDVRLVRDIVFGAVVGKVCRSYNIIIYTPCSILLQSPRAHLLSS